jgi:predicted AAA+ superfamily ATPase
VDWDTGPASALLGLESHEQLSLKPYSGILFENPVILEFLNRRYNRGKSNNLFFWCDNTGNEIDLMIETGNIQVPVEKKCIQPNSLPCNRINP